MGNEKFCTEHNTVFFMKGRMKGYAHPIKDTNGNDTGQWCNMSKEQEVMVEQAPHLETPPVPPVVKSGEPKGNTPKTTDQRIAEQVAIKEIGECLRSGRFTEADKDEALLIECYKNWLLQNMGVWVVEK